MDLAVQQVGGGMSRIAVCVTLFARSDNNPYFDRRISSFHLLQIAGRAHRVSITIIWFIIGICLPRAVAFVSDLPIFKPILVGHVRMSDPGGRFDRRAAAIIHSDECLSANVRGHVDEIAK